MSKSVVILGLSKYDVIKTENGYDEESVDKLFELGEVWTLNDWYQFYPCLWSPTRIYNIHYGNHVHSSQHRFTDNWRNKYNIAAGYGSLIYVTKRIPFVSHKAQRHYPLELLERAKPYYSSIDLMISHAIFEAEYRTIYLRGIRLQKDEYQYYIPGILEVINQAQAAGIMIDCPWLAEWESKNKQLNWDDVQDYKEYWSNSSNICLDAIINKITNLHTNDDNQKD